MCIRDRVKAVEIDKESVAYLYDRFPKLRDNIIGDDFLRMDLTTLFLSLIHILYQKILGQLYWRFR